MNKKLGTILGVIVLVLMAVGIYYYVQILSNGDDAIIADTGLQDSIIGPALKYTNFLLYGIVILVGAFTVMNLATNPKQLVSAGIGVVGILVIYFIAKGQSSDVVLDSYKEYEVTKEISGNVGTGLFAFYWMAGIAFIGAIVGEVVNSIK